MYLCRALSPLLLLLAVSVSKGAIRPSFSETYSAWHATHVIVVDASGGIIESWKGDLKPGGMLHLGSLGVPKNEPISYDFRTKQPDEPERVTGARIVLFLNRQNEQWKPACSFGGMKVAVAWAEKGKVFAFRPEINSGPSLLMPLDLTEEKLKALVREADTVKQEMNRVRAEKDPAKRAEGVIRFLDSKIYGPYWETFEILGGCGKEALPVCRRLLKDPKRPVESGRSLHSCVIEAMVKAAGEDARTDLISLLREEHSYWQKVGPTLKTWWSREPMTSHFCRLHTVLHQLGKLGVTAGERKLVTSVRDFWKSLPQLDTIGNSQIAQAADAVLNKDERPKR